MNRATVGKIQASKRREAKKVELVGKKRVEQHDSERFRIGTVGGPDRDKKLTQATIRRVGEYKRAAAKKK